jgi:hypothetical protein
MPRTRASAWTRPTLAFVISVSCAGRSESTDRARREPASRRSDTGAVSGARFSRIAQVTVTPSKVGLALVLPIHVWSSGKQPGASEPPHRQQSDGRSCAWRGARQRPDRGLGPAFVGAEFQRVRIRGIAGSTCRRRPRSRAASTLRRRAVPDSPRQAGLGLLAPRVTRGNIAITTHRGAVEITPPNTCAAVHAPL